MNHRDLFGDHQRPPAQNFEVAGGHLRLYKSFFDESTADQAFAHLEQGLAWRQDTIKIAGKPVPIPRLQAWYGETGTEYTYSGLKLTPEPWANTLLEIKSQVEPKAGISFNSMLANLYRDGRDSVGWHSDDEKELGNNPVIASVSFGATRNFVLKHRKLRQLEKISLPLEHGDLLVMDGPTQHHWVHQIPKTRKPVRPRINLTFRRICR